MNITRNTTDNSPVTRRSAGVTPGLTAAAIATALTLSACGGSSDAASTTPAGGSTGSSSASAAVTGVQTDAAARALLPQSVKDSNQILLGVTQVTGTSGLPHAGVQDGKEVGLDLDIRAAVAGKLGITFKPQTGTFQTIVPGVQSGKYQVGQANFGVTKDRLKVVDFATYLVDGQSFVGSKDVKVDSVKSLLDVCGLKVATSPGTTFQKLLESNKAECAKAGKQPYTVQYFADTAPIYLGLQNGKVDVYFGPTLSLKVLITKIPGTRYLGEVTHTKVGFVTAKGSPLAPALNAAVNSLIKDGTYAKLFAKWNVADSVIAKSEINPSPSF